MYLVDEGILALIHHVSTVSLVEAPSKNTPLQALESSSAGTTTSDSGCVSSIVGWIVEDPILVTCLFGCIR